MSILDLLRFKQKSSASKAKERLQIVVSHQRADGKKPNFLPQLHKEILEVVSRYTNIDQDKIHVELQNEGDFSVLELNITIPSEVK
jgi:cell division topological specificity factor